MEGWLCDGEPDCNVSNLKDNSDEDPSMCSVNSTCPAGTSPCKDFSCLAISRHCNNVLDCTDSSDEGPFCELKGCDSLNCSYKCKMTREGPRCYCPAGESHSFQRWKRCFIFLEISMTESYLFDLDSRLLAFPMSVTLYLSSY